MPAAVLVVLFLVAASAHAQEITLVPPAPVAPEVMARNAEGHTTIRANRIASPLRLDGRLDEEAFLAVKPFTGFIQFEPNRGQPATDRTEVWIFFDDKNLYLAARCWESPPGRVMADDMRRDGRNVMLGDYIGFALDTFHDHRNGYLFNVGAAGGRLDALATDERQVNGDWNTG